MESKKRKSCLGAFTLIELLVVISIIALLLSILMPSLQKAKKQAQLVVCRSNLHQWAVAIATFSSDNKDRPPLSTAYSLTNGKIATSFPNEMYLDQYAGQYSLTGSPGGDKVWQDKMISHEVISPYLPGFNDLGLRTDSISEFADNEENFLLKGVWRCPNARKREIGLTLEQLTGGTRSFFRLDYAYLGRIDLWDDGMFPIPKDRNALVGKIPTSREIMLTDSVFYWGIGDPTEKIYWYNHGKNGPSGEGDGITTYLQPPDAILGMNQAFGDGAVVWKKINSDDRFVSDGFANKDNRHLFLGYNIGYLFF